MQAVIGTAERERAAAGSIILPSVPPSLMKTNSLLCRLHYHVVPWWEGEGSTSTYLIPPPLLSFLTPTRVFSRVVHLFSLSVNILFADTFISRIIVEIQTVKVLMSTGKVPLKSKC